ncbi:MAG: hypothetical protein SFU98_14335 [Leptospiraceae bacterium]|nr:hypothetical protein [Leptospiraceae bacterium]
MEGFEQMEENFKKHITIDDLSFISEKYSFQSKTNGANVWHSEQGDGLGIFFFNLKPDLPKDITNLDLLEKFYQEQLLKVNGKVVEVDHVELDSCKAIKLIIKLPQDPSGLTYLISFTLPYKDFSFVIKAQCEEYGMTGIKEALLVDRYLGKGGKIEDLQKINFDSLEYDTEFPEHPIERARKIGKDIIEKIKVSDKIKASTPFN